MIRVKAYRVRDFSYKLIIYILFLIIIYILLILLFQLLNSQFKKFDLNMIERNIDLEEMPKYLSLNVNLLKNELGLNHKIERQDINIWTADNTNDMNHLSTIPEMKQNKNTVTSNEHFLSYEEVKSQNRPKKYEVKEISSNKVQVGKATINNYSGINLDFNELSKVSDFPININTNILIFHTHTSEAYEEAGIESNFRTTDDTYNIVAVGETLKENLVLKKFNVLHDITKHDTPSYNGAYNASLATVENLMKKVNYDIIIDLHRDALSGNLHFRPTVEINGETVSKLMFVVGTNGSGLEHDHWMNNLKLALLIQNTAEEMYPRSIQRLKFGKISIQSTFK